MPLNCSQCRKAFNLSEKEPQQHFGDIIFLFNRAQFLPRQESLPACVASASSFGLPFPLAALRSGFRTRPFKITTGHGEAHELAASLSPCHAAAIPHCRVCPSVRHPRSPVSVAGDRARSRAGPYETCPELRETTSTSVGINLDIGQLSKIFAWRKDRIFMVNDEKTAFLPQVAVTKSIRPV